MSESDHPRVLALATKLAIGATACARAVRYSSNGRSRRLDASSEDGGEHWLHLLTESAVHSVARFREKLSPDEEPVLCMLARLCIWQPGCAEMTLDRVRR